MSALLLPALAASSSGQGAPYVDDVFSTYLRTGTGADTTVTTGIDMTKGYMLWSKGRSGATEHAVYDSARGVTLDLATNSTAAQTTQATGLKAVSSTGHTIGSLPKMNTSGATYVDLVFRKAPKFFDVVTYTGNGVTPRGIYHNLGVTPGMIIIKATTAASNWAVWHRGSGAAYGYSASLNLNSAAVSAVHASVDVATSAWFRANAVRDPVYDVMNVNGVQYVAYLFAHDPSADGIIQCGSYTGNGSVTGPVVTLGWEPQYLMIKNTSGTGNWQIIDSMRGMPVGSADATLQANLANAESSVDYVSPTATGFQVTSTSSEVNTSGSTYIYLAIRRPNKPPTSGAQVYSSSTESGVVSAGFPVDLHIGATRTGAASNHTMHARLTGGTRELVTSSTAAEATITDLGFDSMTGLKASLPSGMVNHFFRRAPQFFDVVCYTGTGVARTVPHNLGVAPELMIVKRRSLAGSSWFVYHASIGYSDYLILNAADAKSTLSLVWNTAPTSSAFSVGAAVGVNNINDTFISYLFASLHGISKVGSYTGNGATQTIDCGFSTGARFFLVKATSTTGSWWVYDSARGIVSAADPALQLNSTAAEITSADAVDPTSAGIIVNQEATCSINATGVSYIFLAIA